MDDADYAEETVGFDVLYKVSFKYYRSYRVRDFAIAPVLLCAVVSLLPPGFWCILCEDFPERR